MKKTLFALVAGAAFVPLFAHAQLKNVLNASTIDQLVVLILDAMVYLGTILLLLMLVWTGFLFIRAQGNTEQINQAKNSLFWTVVGGLVLLGASALSLVLQATIESL